jgi:hypothetical protein
MAQVAANASPFSCRWIQRGSETRVSNWSYALCLRIHDEPRLVSETECARCARWEPTGNHCQDGHSS